MSYDFMTFDYNAIHFIFAIKIEKHQTLVHRNLILFGLGHGLSRKLSRTHTHRTSTGREHHRGCAQGGTNSWEL